MKKAVVSILICTLLTFSFFSYTMFSVEAAPGEITAIWICSDMQLGPGHCNAAEWSDSIDDAMNTVGVDYAFNLGDCVDWPDNGPPFDDDWEDFYTNSGQTYGWGDVDGFVNYSNVTIGNHDANWANYLPGQLLNWTYTIGNILFISIGDDCPPEDNYTNPGSGWGEYMYALDWVNQTIQDNQDRNIIMLCHYPVSSTTYGTTGIYAMQDDNDVEYKAMLNWSEDNGYHLDAWVHGHVHIAADQLNMVEKYGTLWIDDLAISTSGGNHDSTFWYFEDGNKTVTIKAYKHDDNTWYSTAYFPHTFDLTYAFDADYIPPVPSTTPQFISIDGGTNGTIIYSSTPTFNWTVVSDTIQYWLQIATDRNFTSLVVDIDDINSEYPEYSANATRVSFTLPDANSLSGDVEYFCRVCAKRL